MYGAGGSELDFGDHNGMRDYNFRDTAGFRLYYDMPGQVQFGLSYAHYTERSVNPGPKNLIGLEVEELEDYWNDQYYHGVSPPYAVDSEDAVIRFVAGSTTGIGYVSACAVDGRVSALLDTFRVGAWRQCRPPLPLNLVGV